MLEWFEGALRMALIVTEDGSPVDRWEREVCSVNLENKLFLLEGS